MPKAIIYSISRSNIIANKDYAWIFAHLRKPLQVRSITYDFDNPDMIRCLVLHAGDADDMVVIFPQVDRIEFEVYYT